MNQTANQTSAFDFSATTIDGKVVSLDMYRGSVLLIVNVASHCGFTGQYQPLQQLHDTYCQQGFFVLGFPCNQFMGQEPESDAQIKEFCSLRYDVSFPMFSKIEVNGSDTHPLYRFLKSQARGLMGSEAIKWNFTKFLVNREGQAVARYSPTTSPISLSGAIEQELKKQV